MQGEKSRDVGRLDRYAQYPPLGFSVMPQGLVAELRDKGVIEPVTVRCRDGERRPDRSTHGHVAQYRIAHGVWSGVELSTGNDAQGDGAPATRPVSTAAGLSP